MKKTKKRTKKKLNAKNSKLLHHTMVTLGAIKVGPGLNEIPLNEVQVHLLDKDGDGIVLCLEYDELTGELHKTFTDTDEYYTTVHENCNVVEFDPCISPENIKTRFEEAISEEYDEIFHDDDDGEPPLLN